MFKTKTLTADAVHLLSLLAARLRAIPGETFNMGNWFVVYDGDYPDPPIPCGSAACAIGHACLMPEFNAAGLVPTRNDPMRNGGMPKLVRPGLPDLSDWAAVTALFDITHEEACFLFLGNRYAYDRAGDPVQPGTSRPTPAQVADRIEWFVAQYGPKETADVQG